MKLRTDTRATGLRQGTTTRTVLTLLAEDFGAVIMKTYATNNYVLFGRWGGGVGLMDVCGLNPDCQV